MSDLPATTDTAYQVLIDEARSIVSHNEINRVKALWELGGVFRRFSEAVDKKSIVGRTVDMFAADLAKDGYDISSKQLYFAQTLNVRFKYEAIESMVGVGMRISHLKVVMPYGEDKAVLAQIIAQARTADGRFVRVDELQAICNSFKRAGISERNKEAIAPSFAEDDDIGPVVEYVDSTSDIEDDVEIDVTTEPDLPEAKEAPKPKKDDGKTGSKGATKTKEFTGSPLGAMKKLESQSTKLNSLIADALIATREAVKVGFDSPVALKNFRQAFGNAHASVRELFEPLKTLLDEMNQTAEDISQL